MSKVFNLQSEDDEEQKITDISISAIKRIFRYGCAPLTCTECPIDQTDDNQARLCVGINKLSKDISINKTKENKNKTILAIKTILKYGCEEIACEECPIFEKDLDLCDGIQNKDAKYHISEFNESYGKGK